MFDKDSFIRKLRLYRRQNHLTQTEFARSVGVSLSTVMRWEHRGKTGIPNLEHLQKIADLIGTPLSELQKLIGVDEDRVAPKPWLALGISPNYYRRLKAEGRLEGYMGRKYQKHPAIKPWTELDISESHYYRLKKTGRLETFTGKKPPRGTDRQQNATGRKRQKYPGAKPWEVLGISVAYYYLLKKTGRLENFKGKKPKYSGTTPWETLGISQAYYCQLRKAGRLETYKGKQPPKYPGVKPWVELGITYDHYTRLRRTGQLEGYTGRKRQWYPGVKPWEELGITKNCYYHLRKTGQLESFKNRKESEAAKS